MDMNVYFAEWLIKERLAEARAAGARDALFHAHRPPRQPMRVALGLARLHKWLLDPKADIQRAGIPHHCGARLIQRRRAAHDIHETR